MGVHALGLSVLFLLASGISAETTSSVFYAIGETLRVRQWCFLGDGYPARKPTAHFLARNRQPSLSTNKYNTELCGTFGTIIVSELSFSSTLNLIKVGIVRESDVETPFYLPHLVDFPKCYWIIRGVYNESLVEDLPPLHSIIILFEETKSGLRLTMVQKPCLKCLIVAKTIVFENNAVAEPKELLLGFFDRRLDFLNDSDVDVSIDSLLNCDALGQNINDPFVLVQCYQLDILETLATKLRFRLNRVLPIHSEYPYHFPNGSEGGLFIQLDQRAIDISAASVVVTDDRLESWDSVWPTFVLKASIFIKSGRNEISWLGYFQPFSKHIWLSTTGAILAGSLVVILITCFVRYQNNQRQLIILFPIFYILQVFCLQSFPKIPKLISSRIAFISLLITAATLLSAYSGSLVSFLTIKRQSYPFKTLPGFIENGQFQILIRRNHFLQIHLRMSRMTNLTSLILPEEQLVTDDQEGFDRLCDNWLAYIIEDILFKPALRQYACRVIQTPVTYTKEYFAITLPKNSPLTEQIRVSAIQARSSGFKDCLEKFILQQTRPKNIVNEFFPVTMVHVAPMFVFLVMFTILAWLIFGVEVYVR